LRCGSLPLLFTLLPVCGCLFPLVATTFGSRSCPLRLLVHGLVGSFTFWVGCVYGCSTLRCGSVPGYVYCHTVTHGSLPLHVWVGFTLPRLITVLHTVGCYTVPRFCDTRYHTPRLPLGYPRHHTHGCCWTTRVTFTRTLVVRLVITAHAYHVRFALRTFTRCCVGSRTVTHVGWFTHLHFTFYILRFTRYVYTFVTFTFVTRFAAFYTFACVGLRLRSPHTFTVTHTFVGLRLYTRLFTFHTLHVRYVAAVVTRFVTFWLFTRLRTFTRFTFCSSRFPLCGCVYPFVYGLPHVGTHVVHFYTTHFTRLVGSLHLRLRLRWLFVCCCYIYTRFYTVGCGCLHTLRYARWFGLHTRLGWLRSFYVYTLVWVTVGLTHCLFTLRFILRVLRFCYVGLVTHHTRLHTHVHLVYCYTHLRLRLLLFYGYVLVAVTVAVTFTVGLLHRFGCYTYGWVMQLGFYHTHAAVTVGCCGYLYGWLQFTLYCTLRSRFTLVVRLDSYGYVYGYGCAILYPTFTVWVDFFFTRFTVAVTFFRLRLRSVIYTHVVPVDHFTLLHVGYVYTTFVPCLVTSCPLQLHTRLPVTFWLHVYVHIWIYCFVCAHTRYTFAFTVATRYTRYPLRGCCIYGLHILHTFVHTVTHLLHTHLRSAHYWFVTGYHGYYHRYHGWLVTFYTHITFALHIAGWLRLRLPLFTVRGCWLRFTLRLRTLYCTTHTFYITHTHYTVYILVYGLPCTVTLYIYAFGYTLVVYRWFTRLRLRFCGCYVAVAFGWLVVTLPLRLRLLHGLHLVTFVRLRLPFWLRYGCGWLGWVASCCAIRLPHRLRCCPFTVHFGWFICPVVHTLVTLR